MTDSIKSYRIPNPQVKGVADQFNNARRLLEEQPPMSAVLWPQLHLTAMTLELYLKSLASRDDHQDVGHGVYKVGAIPDSKTHSLTDLLSRIQATVREQLQQAYRERRSSQVKGTLSDALKPYNTLCEASRYPFDPTLNASDFDLNKLQELTDIIAEFVNTNSNSEELRGKYI